MWPHFGKAKDSWWHLEPFGRWTSPWFFKDSHLSKFHLRWFPPDMVFFFLILVFWHLGHPSFHIRCLEMILISICKDVYAQMYIDVCIDISIIYIHVLIHILEPPQKILQDIRSNPRQKIQKSRQRPWLWCLQSHRCDLKGLFWTFIRWSFNIHQPWVPNRRAHIT